MRQILKLSNTYSDILVSALDFTVEKVDDFGTPIQLVDPVSQDTILFEVSYTTIEFAFGKAETIQEVEERFSIYMEAIQTKLAESNHAIVGCGIHPNWDKNENCPVAYPRYQMLMDYLNLSRNVTKSDLHHFPEYGAFICGSQVQLDVSKSNYLRVINTFTQIEAVKAYLFANSGVYRCGLGIRKFQGIFSGKNRFMVSIQKTSGSMLDSLKMRMIFLII